MRFLNYIEAWDYFDMHVMNWKKIPGKYSYDINGDTKWVVQTFPDGATNAGNCRIVQADFDTFLKQHEIEGV